LDEVDESETGSANLWSDPRKGVGLFSGPYGRWQPPEPNAGDFITRS
jgi:hypothetical protein